MRARRGRGIWLAAGLAVGLAGGGLAPVGAGGKRKLNSFEGSCSLHGPVEFTPPVNNTQQSLKAVLDGTGTCTGTLNGKKLKDARVKIFHVGENINGSCMRADTTTPARGAMTFPDGTILRYSFEFHFILTEGDFTFRGQRSGAGHGHGSFLTQETPPDTVVKCGGEGAEEVPLDISLNTDSPLRSSHKGGGKS